MMAAADLSISDFLQSLAAREPAPGGGASAALHAAQGAALVAMIANFSDCGEDEQTKALAARVAEEAQTLRAKASDLIQRDIDGFGAVASAYGLAKGTNEEKAARKSAIASASIPAAQAPADVIAVAVRVVELCGDLMPIANRNVISDVAAAADAARAAATTARLNVEINLGSITDADSKASLNASLAQVDATLERADAISADVRAGV